MLARPITAPLVATLLALAVGIAAELGIRLDEERNEQDRRSQVTGQLGQIRAVLEGELNATLHITRGMVAYVATHPDLEPGLMEPMLRTLYGEGRHLRNIAVAPGNRIAYVYPLKGNEKALGLHYPERKDQWPSVERAMRERHPRLAGPVNLAQGGVGFIYRVPIFLEGSGDFWGLISMVIDSESLLAGSGIAERVGGLELALRGRDGDGAKGEVFLGQPSLFAPDSVQATIRTPGGDWQIAARPADGWRSGDRGTWLRAGGWLIALALALSVHQALASAARRLNAEAEVERSRDRLNEAQRLARVGSWTLDHRSRELSWSPEVFHIFELDPAGAPPSYEVFLGIVHPEDRERVDRTFVESLANRRPYDATHRLLLPDGRIKFVHERGETDVGPDGRPILSRGTVQDITEMRRAEEALRLYGMAFQYSGEAILISDRENRIVSVNPAFTTYTGYEIEDLRGKNPRVLSSGHTPRETYSLMWAALAEAGYWQGELWDRRKDGQVFPKWATISAIRNEAGDVTHYIASFTDISERKAAEERIHRLAHHDALTGLINRFSLEDRLEQALATARRDGSQVAVMFIDMDRFKIINDTLGHHAGDELLVEVAHRLRSAVRESDIVARLGGDEFVVALTGIDAVSASAAVADKILESLGRPYLVAGAQTHSTPSLGISVFPDDGTDVGTLMKSADTAMYHAKDLGRNNYQFFTAAMTAAASERLEIERNLRSAMASGQLLLHYQPQVHAAGSLAGFEALVRWRHPELGMIPPMKFIPVAEETGLIEALGDWILDQACRQLADWRRQGLPPVRMAVSLSLHQLRSASFVDRVRRLLADHGLGEGDLELEITESAAMRDPARTIDQLAALRALGIELAIDDFGTGYSSLAYLKLLPIHALKLDRSFVRDIETDDNDAAICSATLALAHSLGLRVVAEGVETEAQQNFLAGMGCDFLQGYLIARPMAADEATAYLAKHAPCPA